MSGLWNTCKEVASLFVSWNKNGHQSRKWCSFLQSEINAFRESSKKKFPLIEEEVCYRNCRAAYLTVFSLENISSKDQLYLALQHAGRNPSQKTINKHSTPQTAKLNFDDFCIILRKEKPISKAELPKSFKQLDVNDYGYILHTVLYKRLTKRWEDDSRRSKCHNKFG